MKIYLEKKELDFTEQNLPILIHGEEGQGASLYAIQIAVDFSKNGHSLIFLCGYKMAQEEFIKQGGNQANVLFYTKEKVEDFKKYISQNNISNSILLIKNVELFDISIIDMILGKKNVIVSGDINESLVKSKILSKNYYTAILFSDLENFNIPILEKYEGYLTSHNLKGITYVKGHL